MDLCISDVLNVSLLCVVRLENIMIYSMTAFARYEKKYVWGDISCEIRSLNQRYLEICIDAPKYLHGISWEIRKKIKNFIVRGKVECCLHIEMNNAVTGEFNVNEDLVHRLIVTAQWIKKQINEGEINPLLVLSFPGVITYKNNDIINVNVVLLECFEKALHHLKQDREREGLFLKKSIIERLWNMREEVEKLRQYIPDVLDLKRKRLLEQMQAIRVCVDNVRLEQELLVITQKIDISEEIDRLISHMEEVYNILSQKGPMGRRLDFISQELYREVNTISSKSINFNITKSAIALKVFIEQIREQVQNIE